jgi:hypothetical protein
MDMSEKSSKRKLSPGEGRSAIAWGGDDPILYTRIVAALEDANVAMFDMEEHDQFFTVPMISGPRYRVLVAESDLARAERAIQEALGKQAGE